MRKFILLADGGALADFNDRLKAEGRAHKDFVKVPDRIIERVREETDVECPKGSRIFCNVGFEKASSFLAAIAETWTVRTFPLTVAKYERAGNGNITGRHPFRLRFHAYLGYVLGLLTQAEDDDLPLIGIATDDPHLLPCMADSQSRGCETRLIWWESAITDEVSFQAARQGVRVLHLPDDDATSTKTQDEALQTLIPPRPRIGRHRDAERHDKGSTRSYSTHGQNEPDKLSDQTGARQRLTASRRPPHR